MVKKKKSESVNYKKVLPSRQYAEYRKLKQSLERKQAQERLKNLRKQAKYQRWVRTYEATPTGKTGRIIGQTIGTLQRKHGVTNLLYRNQVNPTRSNTSTSTKTFPTPYRTGKVGRPYGSVKPEYAKFGGVYEFRKAQAHRRALERAQYLRDRAITPSQQEALRQIELRQATQRQNMEARPIPDTRGDVSLQGIFQEIDNASHAFD